MSGFLTAMPTQPPRKPIIRAPKSLTQREKETHVHIVANYQVQVIGGALMITSVILLYLDHVGAQEESAVKLVSDRWKRPTPLPLIIVEAAVSILVPLLLIICVCSWLRNANPQDADGSEPAAGEPVAGSRLDQQMIELFPVHSFSSDEMSGFGQSECLICLEEFMRGEDIRVLPDCRYIFHFRCISSWFTSSGRRCPVCRQDYSQWEPEAARHDIP